MVRCCNDRDFEQILSIINDGAQAYRGIIPADCWTDPYRSEKALAHEINEGVVFWCFEQASTLVGVMGNQEVQDVSLIRHAYVRRTSRNCSHLIDARLSRSLFFFLLVSFGFFLERNPHHSGYAFGQLFFKLGALTIPPDLLRSTGVVVPDFDRQYSCGFELNWSVDVA